MGDMNAHSPARRGTPTRHERRPIRSSLTGPALANPSNRFKKFEADARGAVTLLYRALAAELDGVHIGFQTMPTTLGNSSQPTLYTIDREQRRIILFRMPIQRARGLHVEDDEHRRYFVEHCVYRAVCEYLGREPWELLPGRFEHY